MRALPARPAAPGTIPAGMIPTGTTPTGMTLANLIAPARAVVGLRAARDAASLDAAACGPPDAGAGA